MSLPLMTYKVKLNIILTSLTSGAPVLDLLPLDPDFLRPILYEGDLEFLGSFIISNFITRPFWLIFLSWFSFSSICALRCSSFSLSSLDFLITTSDRKCPVVYFDCCSFSFSLLEGFSKLVRSWFSS